MKNIIIESNNKEKNLKENLENIESFNSKILKISMDWIRLYESKKHDFIISEIQCQILWYLVLKNIDIYEIRNQYKSILDAVYRFDSNYYAHICILLNVMKNKHLANDFDSSKEVSLSSFSYIQKDMTGIMSATLGHKSYCIKENNSNVKFEYVEYPEGTGINKTNAEYFDKLKAEANDLLSQEKIDIDLANKWIANYKKYIIGSYGRWSKQFEEFMNISFTVSFCPISPNLLLKALRDTLRKGITKSLEIC